MGTDTTVSVTSRPRVAIIGSRHYDVANDMRIRRFIEQLPPRTAIVTGCAAGADEAARKWGNHFGHVVVECKANWVRKGRGAGPIRNEVIADIADRVAAFYVDGVQHVGTDGCCALFMQRNKPIARVAPDGTIT